MSTRSVVLITCGLLIAAGCANRSAAGTESAPPPPAPLPATTMATAATTTSSTSTTSTSSSSSSSSSSSTTTTTSTSSTSSTSPTTTTPPLPKPSMPAANQAFDRLARGGAATMTVVRDGRTALQRAWGTTIDGAPATSDSPMVVASVGKLLTALMIARLDEAGAIDVDAPMPWTDIGVSAHPGWADVTLRELLAHTSGMPVERRTWFDGGVDCAGFLPSLLDRPPSADRGDWTYSNGNYCALGLLVEHVTGLPLDGATQALLFDPVGSTGAHLATDGQLSTDVGYGLGVERLTRLGGAGAFIVSTDDLAGVLAGVTASDRSVLSWPGVMVDQYGWGHTGTVDGALACAWVLEGGRTVVAATVSGRSPSTGGEVCDLVVPAVADDLGIGQGDPDRSPP